MFVESAGRPNVIAGNDPADASGLTQILAQTGQSLLGMHVNLARSRQLTGEDRPGGARGGSGWCAPAAPARRRSTTASTPPRRSPRPSATSRSREQHFGRADLAVESYHMGIGNLQNVLNDYDGGRAVPYAQLYFDTAPDHHASAYNLISGFGDDSSLYYWRVLGAEQIMRLYRTDRGRSEPAELAPDRGRLAGVRAASAG